MQVLKMIGGLVVALIVLGVLAVIGGLGILAIIGLVVVVLIACALEEFFEGRRRRKRAQTIYAKR